MPEVAWATTGTCSQGAAPALEAAFGDLLWAPWVQGEAGCWHPGAHPACACRYVIEEDLLALALNGRYQKADLSLDCRPERERVT